MEPRRGGVAASTSAPHTCWCIRDGSARHAEATFVSGPGIAVVKRYVDAALASLSAADPARRWTVREAAQFIGLGGRGPILTGSPAEVADQLEHWMDATGIDGFNLAFAVSHESMRDVVDLIVPELRRRGRYRSGYDGGTLRHQLHGKGDRLPADHPGRKVTIGGNGSSKSALPRAA